LLHLSFQAELFVPSLAGWLVGVVTSRYCARQPLTSLVKFPDQTLFA